MATTPKKPTKRTTAKKAPKPKGLDVEALLAGKLPPTIDFPICTVSELADERDLAKQALDIVQGQVEAAERLQALRPNSPPLPTELLDERDEAQEKWEKAAAVAKAKTIPFKLRAMPRAALLNLYSLHPPTDFQRRKFKEEVKAAGLPATSKLDFNELTFPPAMVYRSIIFPEMSWESVKEMWHGPICSECGGDGVGCEEGTTVMDGDHAECRQPELGVWSKAELDGLFVAATTINKLIK